MSQVGVWYNHLLWLEISVDHRCLRFAQTVSCIGSGQPRLNHRFCEDIIGHGLVPKIVWGAEAPRAGIPGKDPALIQMGDWYGAFYLRFQRRRHNGCDVPMQRWIKCIFMLFSAGSHFGYWPGRANGWPLDPDPLISGSIFYAYLWLCTKSVLPQLAA